MRGGGGGSESISDAGDGYYYEQIVVNVPSGFSVSGSVFVAAGARDDSAWAEAYINGPGSAGCFAAAESPEMGGDESDSDSFSGGSSGQYTLTIEYETLDSSANCEVEAEISWQ